MKITEFRKLIREEVRKIIKEAQVPATWEDAIDQGKEVPYLQNELDQDMKGFTKPFKATVNKQSNESFIYINAKDKSELIEFLKKRKFKYVDDRNSIGQGNQYFKKIGGAGADMYILKTKKI
jgi:hypothetical protein